MVVAQVVLFQRCIYVNREALMVGPEEGRGDPSASAHVHMYRDFTC
jgi:hypothetical protein